MATLLFSLIKRRIKMEKPLSIVIEEFKSNIEKAIKDSQLPTVILEMIFKDMYRNVSELSRQIQQHDLMQYNKSIEQKSEEKTEE